MSKIFTNSMELYKLHKFCIDLSVSHLVSIQMRNFSTSYSKGPFSVNR